MNSEKEKGLYKKYEVTKLTNPEKEVDALVLEFDDEFARDAILTFAETMLRQGYTKFHNDIIDKVAEQQKKEGTFIGEE